MRRSLAIVSLLVPLVLAGRPAEGRAQPAAPPADVADPAAGALPAAWTASGAPAQEPEPPEPGYIENQLIVGFAPAATAADKQALHERYGAQVIAEIPQINAQVLRFQGDDALAMVSIYQAQPTVRYAEPDYIASIPERELIGPGSSDGGAIPDRLGPGRLLGLLANPNDSLYSQQWHHTKINTAAGWEYGRAAGVTIAIVDTGVSCNHPDLQGKCVAGYDHANGDADPSDDHGHGTHVAGIAAAQTNNGTGVAGVGWEARIMPVKALGASGNGSHSAIANAIIWAADHGAQVINMSLGGPFTTSTLANAVSYAISQKGVTLVAAAGNENTSNPSYPAAYPNVIGISATTQSDSRASFSNYGDAIDVAAPGVAILSTVTSGGYQAWSGTSMAAPVAAGLAALLKGQNASRTPAQIEQLLEQSADDLGASGWDQLFGWGRINAARAMAQSPGGSTPGATAPPSPTVRIPTPVQPTALPTASGNAVQQVEDLINRERATYGLPGLLTHSALRQASQRHSNDMALSLACRHDGSDGSSPYTRMRDAGYSSPYGEIVACGQTSPAAVVQAWMNSEGHRAIILCGSCTEFGAGFREANDGYRRYWTVTFGSRRVSGPTATIVPSATPAAPTATSRPTATFTPGPPTPTSLPGSRDVVLRPGPNHVGWVVSSQPSLNHFDDEDTYTGTWNGRIYHGAMQLDLSSIPANARLNFARLELTGRSRQFLGTSGTWSVKLLATAIDADFVNHGYTAIHGAAVDATMLPLLGVNDLVAGQVNTFNFAPSQLTVLQSRIAGSRAVSFRIDGPPADPTSNLFTWDTGYGPETTYPGPQLVLNFGTGLPTGVPSLTPSEVPPPSPTVAPPTAGPSATATATSPPPTRTATAPPPPPTRTPTATLPPPIPTADLGEGAVEIRPQAPEDVGWVRQNEMINHFGDAYTYSGYYYGLIYHGAVQFDLSAIPPGSAIRAARLTLTGNSTRYLSTQGNGLWNVKLLGPAIDAGWRRSTFGTLDGAEVLSMLTPELRQADLDLGRANVFVFNELERRALSFRVDTTRKISFRFDGPRAGISNVFSWDSGFGSASRQPPVLSVVFGPARDVEPGPTTAPPNLDLALAVIARINAERSQAGLRQLAISSPLMDAATDHTDDMVRFNFFSHTGSDGSQPEDRVRRAGFDALDVGEVLAALSADPNAVVDAWMSRPQREVILTPHFTHIGAAMMYRAGTAYGNYWTVNLAEAAAMAGH
jgi:thermitase